MKYELITSTEDTITVREIPNWFNTIIGIVPNVQVYKHENEVYKQSRQRVWYNFDTGIQIDGDSELDALYRKSMW